MKNVYFDENLVIFINQRCLHVWHFYINFKKFIFNWQIIKIICSLSLLVFSMFLFLSFEFWYKCVYIILNFNILVLILLFNFQFLNFVSIFYILFYFWFLLLIDKEPVADLFIYFLLNISFYIWKLNIPFVFNFYFLLSLLSEFNDLINYNQLFNLLHLCPIFISYFDNRFIILLSNFPIYFSFNYFIRDISVDVILFFLRRQVPLHDFIQTAFSELIEKPY